MSLDARDQPPAGRLLLTCADDWALPDDGRRDEVLEGEREVRPFPGRSHQRAVGNRFVHLQRFVEAQGPGEAFPAPFDVILEETSVVVPDLASVSRERSGIVPARGIRGAPDLVVEVLSAAATARRDRVAKARLHARHGARYAWLVDPEARTLEVDELSDGQYRRTAGLTGDAVSSPPLFPGLEVPPGSLWGR